MVTMANAIQMNQQTGYQPTMQFDPTAAYYAMLGIPPPMLSVGSFGVQAQSPNAAGTGAVPMAAAVAPPAPQPAGVQPQQAAPNPEAWYNGYTMGFTPGVFQQTAAQKAAEPWTGGPIQGVGQAADGYMDPWEAEALRRRKAEAAAAGIPLGGGANAGRGGQSAPAPSGGVQASYMAKLAAQVASGAPAQPQTTAPADDEAKKRAAKMAQLSQTIAA